MPQWNRGGKIEKTTISCCFASFLVKICTNHAFLCIFQPFLRFILEIALWITALVFPYIVHERTAQNLNLSVHSLLFFLNRSFAPEIKVCSRAKSDIKERCAQLCIYVHRYRTYQLKYSTCGKNFCARTQWQWVNDNVYLRMQSWEEAGGVWSLSHFSPIRGENVGKYE